MLRTQKIDIIKSFEIAPCNTRDLLNNFPQISPSDSPLTEDQIPKFRRQRTPDAPDASWTR